MFANDGRRLEHALSCAIASGLKSGGDLALVTVVATSGSTYRKSGARMLVPLIGEAIGILSGGCLEDDIIEAARKMLASAANSRLLFFDLMPESEFLLGYGKGCSGQLTVLVERVSRQRHPMALGALVRSISVPEKTAVALVYDVVADADGSLPVPGDRLLFDASGRLTAAYVAFDKIAAEFVSQLQSIAQQGWHAGKPSNLDFIGPAGRVAVSITYKEPPLDLVVFGAGPDAPAVVQFADRLGWDTRVCDHRPGRLDAARFPRSTTLVSYNPETIDAAVPASEATAVVVMTHNLLIDAEVLRWAETRPLAYLGLLGPAHRRARIFTWLRSQGVDLEASLSSRLYSPIGLDLGGDGEVDIALAVTAEIQKLKHNTAAKHKRVGKTEEDKAQKEKALSSVPGRRNLHVTV